MKTQLHPQTLLFLKKLKTNNNKIWFDANRDQYETVRTVFIEFVQSLINKLAETDRSLVTLKAKDCVFRINRDIRFSKDKTPYKTNFSAVISSGGRKDFRAGFYISIEPGNKNYMGGGIWQPEAKNLAAIRQEVDYNYDEYKKITASKVFSKTFNQLYNDSLKTMPKGYSDSNKAASVLKQKSFVYGSTLDDSTVASEKYFATLVNGYKTILPFFSFLNRAIS